MADFIAKLGIVVEEADETVYWLDLLAEAGLVKKELLRDLQQEAGELLAIFSASQLTAKGRRSSIVNAKIVNRQSDYVLTFNTRYPPPSPNITSGAQAAIAAGN